MAATGMDTMAMDQNTHDQDANCTKMAPMINPSAVRRRSFSSYMDRPQYSAGKIISELTICDTPAANKDGNGTRLLSRLREDVDEEREGGRNGHSTR